MTLVVYKDLYDLNRIVSNIYSTYGSDLIITRVANKVTRMYYPENDLTWVFQPAIVEKLQAYIPTYILCSLQVNDPIIHQELNMRATHHQASIDRI